MGVVDAVNHEDEGLEGGDGDGVVPKVLVCGKTFHDGCSVARQQKSDVFAGGGLSSWIL